MYLTILSMVIIYKIADISGMIGWKWAVLTLVANIALGPVIPFDFWRVPVACILVYIPLLMVSLRNGPQ